MPARKPRRMARCSAGAERAAARMKWIPFRPLWDRSSPPWKPLRFRSSNMAASRSGWALAGFWGAECLVPAVGREWAPVLWLGARTTSMASTIRIYGVARRTPEAPARAPVGRSPLRGSPPSMQVRCSGIAPLAPARAGRRTDSEAAIPRLVPRKSRPSARQGIDKRPPLPRITSFVASEIS